ncbi:DsbA family protein [Thermomonas flagellata]|uniref:DsbA family protein n=1 Tax=Thermomonas flagellata TaxID=2888524 RepID=UPI001F042E29|nr:DsbA family protein [Thermomonas flagellata]
MRALLLSLLLLLTAAPLAQAQSLPGLTEGKEYRSIPGGTPFRAVPGQVEVAEVFAYWCPHCAHFAPMLDAWARRLPAWARLQPVPLPSGPEDALARAYFAAEAAKAVPVVHPALFRAIHETQQLPRQPDAAQVRAFVAKLPGIDQAAFAAALRDDAGMRARLAQAYQFAQRSDIPGTPSLVIAGRYLVLGNSYQELLDNAGKVLAALAPAAKPAAKPAPLPATKPAPARP